MNVRVVDSSLLIEADYRRKLGALAKYLGSDPRAIAPPEVYTETVITPKALPYLAASATRIEGLYSRGVITTQTPDYTNRRVSKIVDRVRGCIANKANKPVHEVEIADLQIVALAVTAAFKGEAVELIFRDRALRDCLESAMKRNRVSSIVMIDSSELLDRI